MVAFQQGDPVVIIRGVYARNGHGTYLGAYGTVMCRVAVAGDNRPERRLWLTSIRAPTATFRGGWQQQRQAQRRERDNDKDR